MIQNMGIQIPDSIHFIIWTADTVYWYLAACLLPSCSNTTRLATCRHTYVRIVNIILCPYICTGRILLVDLATSSTTGSTGTQWLAGWLAGRRGTRLLV